MYASPYYKPQQPAAPMQAKVARARSVRPPMAGGGGAAPVVNYDNAGQDGPAPVTRMAPAAGQPASVDDRISYRNMTPPAQQPAAMPRTAPSGGGVDPALINVRGATAAQARPQPQRSTARTVPSARAAYAPQYSQPNAQPNATRRAPGVDAREEAWATDATNARYIGKSGGKQRFIGADGKTEYTNDDRNHAIKQIQNPNADFRGDLEDPMSEASLRDRWGQAIDQDGQMVDQSGQKYWEDAGATDDAIDGVGDWNPDDLEGWDTDRLRDVQPTNRRGWSPTALDGFDSTETRNVDLSGVRNYQPRNLSGVDTSRLKDYNGGSTIQQYLEQTGGAGGGYDGNVQAGTSGFNAMEAVKTAAQGAGALAKVTLGDQLEQEANAAARSGRLETGLFDRDKGRVITRVGENLNSQILDRSVDAAGIQASIENSNAGNITQANVAAGREKGNIASLRSGEARDAAQLGYQALESGTGYDVDIAGREDQLGLDAADSYAGHQIDRAAGIDRNRLTASEATDRMRLDNAGGMDDFELDAASAWTDAEGRKRTALNDSRYGARRDRANLSLDRQGLSQRLWDTSQDRYGDRIASERDRVTGKANFDAQMKQQERQSKRDMWGNIIGGVTRVGAAVAGG